MQHAEIGGGAFLVDEVRSGEQFSRRVVDRAHQAQPRPAPLEPVVPAPIPQQHQARLGLALAALAMAARAPVPDRGHARRPQEAAHGGDRDPQRRRLRGELFGEVRVVEVPILLAPQADDPHPHARPERVHRHAARIAMPQRPPPFRRHPVPQPPHLPDGERQDQRRLRHRQLAGPQPADHFPPLPLPLAHQLHPLSMPGGRTKSLSA